MRWEDSRVGSFPLHPKLPSQATDCEGVCGVRAGRPNGLTSPRFNHLLIPATSTSTAPQPPATFCTRFVYALPKSTPASTAQLASIPSHTFRRNCKMSATLLRSTPALRGALRAGAAKPVMGMASTQFVRGKATLPDLSCKSIYLLVSPEAFVLCDACDARGRPQQHQHANKVLAPGRRLRRTRASHFRPDHGAAPLQAPPDLRQRPQQRHRDPDRG